MCFFLVFYNDLDILLIGKSIVIFYNFDIFIIWFLFLSIESMNLIELFGVFCHFLFFDFDNLAKEISLLVPIISFQYSKYHWTYTSGCYLNYQVVPIMEQIHKCQQQLIFLNRFQKLSFFVFFQSLLSFLFHRSLFF